MVRAETRFGWYWRRGKKILGPVSHRELRLLAEFGHLRPDDLLWRPGLAGWTPPSSVRGVLPLRDSQTKLWDLTGIVGSNELRKFAASSRQLACSMKVGWQRAYDRMAAALAKFGFDRARPSQTTAGHRGRLTGHRSPLRSRGPSYEVFIGKRQQDPVNKIRSSKISGSSTHRVCCVSPTFHQSLGANPTTRPHGCGSLQRQQWSPDGRTCPSS